MNIVPVNADIVNELDQTSLFFAILKGIRPKSPICQFQIQKRIKATPDPVNRPMIVVLFQSKSFPPNCSAKSNCRVLPEMSKNPMKSR